VGKYTYSEFFELFPKLYSGFEEAVNHAGNFRRELDSKKILTGVNSLLSIGPGNGQLELALCRDYGIAVGLVEPEKTYLANIERRAREMQVESQILETSNKPFQSFSSEKKYDSIISIHSWYALGMNLETLKHVLEFLEPGGKLFIALVAPESPLQKIAIATGNDSGQLLDSKILSNWLTRQHIKHEYWVNTNELGTREIEVDGEFTKKGQALVSFPAFTPWKEMDKTTKTEVREILHESKKEGYFQLKNGCILIKK
jgi:cyclopropane fatty-acyl-phospholipid synthase-like methyltransferase